MKIVHIDSLINIIKSVIISINHAYAFISFNSVMFGNGLTHSPILPRVFIKPYGPVGQNHF